MSRPPTIVAMGGGGFGGGTTSPDPLDELVLELTARDRPKVCLLPTAGADAREGVTRFYDVFSRRAEPTWLPLFERRDRDLRTLLLGQDAILVGGGNTANMLAIWRLHGVDTILREAWARGVVLAGVSAGGLCWFESGSSDSFGPWLAPLDGLLGLVPGAFCPHYDGEPLRRPRLHELVASGALPATYACDDGTAVVFEDSELREAVTSRAGAAVYRVELVDGAVRERVLPVRSLV